MLNYVEYGKENKYDDKRLPELGQSIGKMLAEFKAAVNKTDNDKKDEEDKTKD